MKITVINGTEKQGVTYRLKEKFLERFRGSAQITEFYLPKDCPAFCSGCAVCFARGEENCPHSVYVAPIRAAIEEADLLVFATPTYVYHTPGAMKTFLDFMGVRWMPHRPSPDMFGKRAVIITQCMGAGARSAAKDIKDSLIWWGISEIGIFSDYLWGRIVWDRIPEKKRNKLTKKISKLSLKFSEINYQKPARSRFGVRFRFFCCRILHKTLIKRTDSPDSRYWKSQGWLEKARPWKKK